MTRLSELPSWEPRMRLFVAAGVCSSVSDRFGFASDEYQWAGWFMARARREFAAALDADTAFFASRDCPRDTSRGTCGLCGGGGWWAVVYPRDRDATRVTCRMCRCRCGAVLDPTVAHDDDITGAPLCERCCPTCKESS